MKRILLCILLETVFIVLDCLVEFTAKSHLVLDVGSIYFGSSDLDS